MKKSLKKWLAAAIVLGLALAALGSWYAYGKVSGLAPVPAAGMKLPQSKQKTPPQWLDFAEGKKIWVHAAYRAFDPSIVRQNVGVELDIMIGSREGETLVYINHDQAHGIQLSEWIDKLEGSKSNYYYWLDVKNLTPENLLQAHAAISAILDRHHIPHRQVVIESPEPELLGAFTRDDYMTSYYLPELASDAPDFYQQLEALIERAGRCDIVSVSSGMWGYEIYGKVFPDMVRLHWGASAYTKPKPLKLWLFRLLYRPTVNHILDDPKVRVMLVHPARPLDETKRIVTGRES